MSGPSEIASGPTLNPAGSLAAPRFVDTHVHLDEPAFDDDRDAVIARATAAGVTRLVNIGYRPARWASTIGLQRDHAEVSVVLGLHPQQAEEFTDRTCAELEAVIRSSGARAVGEIGLDYLRDYASPDRQRRAFAAQLELSVGLGLPVVIHQRNAEDDCWDMLRGVPPTLPVVLHCFEGAPPLLALGLERGYYFGLGGLVTRVASSRLRDALPRLPIARILLETDSPYLTPAGIRARRNEPANIPAIARVVSDLCGKDLDEIAATTTANAVRVFGLDQICPAAAGKAEAPG